MTRRNRAAIINVVGLTSRLIGPNTPRLLAAAEYGGLIRVKPVEPAVTCTMQATYLTGLPPSGHGVVANGWYNRELAEHDFWKQSNHLVHGKKLWEKLRCEQPGVTCANLFWWFNMYSSVEYSITPRPLYLADGRKVFDIHSFPPGVRGAVQTELGPFPFPAFWGPAAGSKGKFAPDEVSRWIAESAKWIERKYHPTLSLIYLPHLDYNLQRLGPAHAEIHKDYARIDDIVGDLITFSKARR